MDPTVSLEVLEKRWVPQAIVLYIGRASGPGVRSLPKYLRSVG